MLGRQPLQPRAPAPARPAPAPPAPPGPGSRRRGARRAAVRLAARRQPLQPVLADRLQHREAGLAVDALRLAQQALVDQRRDEIERSELTSRGRGVASGGRHSATASARLPSSDPRPPPHRLGRLEREAAGEDGQPAKERLLVRRQQVVAPGDGVAHRPLAGRQVARAAGQQRPAAAPAGPAGPRAAGGGSAPPPARSPAAARPAARQIVADRRRRCPRSGRSRAGRPGARSTKRRTASARAAAASDGGRRGPGGDPARQGRHRVARARPQTRSARPAGGQHRQARAGGQQVGDERPRPAEHLLEVVEHQQQRAAPEARDEAVARAAGRRVSRTPSAWAIVGSTRAGSRERREVDEGDAVGEVGRPASAATARARRVLPTPPGPVSVSSRAAGASGPAQSSRADRRQLALPADQRGQRRRRARRPRPIRQDEGADGGGVAFAAVKWTRDGHVQSRCASQRGTLVAMMSPRRGGVNGRQRPILIFSSSRERPDTRKSSSGLLAPLPLGRKITRCHLLHQSGSFHPRNRLSDPSAPGEAHSPMLASAVPTVEVAATGRLTAPGAILLVSCYELGHQPLSLAAPLARLRRGGLRAGRRRHLGRDSDRRGDPGAHALGRDLGADAHRAAARGRGSPARARAVNPTAHICFYGLYADAQRRLPACATRRQRDRRRVRGSAAGPGAGARPRRADRRLPNVGTSATAGAAGARPSPSGLRLIVPERGELPPLRSYAGLERDGDDRPGRLRRGDARLPPHLPPLPDPADLRRALLRRPARGGAGRCARPGRRRRPPPHLRRPRLLQRPRPRAADHARAARGVPVADLRRHDQGRAPAPAPPSSPRAGRAGLRLRRLGGRVAQRPGARQAGQGAHAAPTSRPRSTCSTRSGSRCAPRCCRSRPGRRSTTTWSC